MNIGLIISLVVIVVIITIIAGVFIISRMKGKIIISLSNYNYSPGDTINGQVTLKLRKSVEASALNVRLTGERHNRSIANTGGRNQPNNQIVFDFAQPIDGEKIYSAGEQTYNFSIKIPQSVNTNLEGIAGTVVKSIQILAGQDNLVKWYLTSTLEAKGINVKSKKVQVNIG